MKVITGRALAAALTACALESPWTRPAAAREQTERTHYYAISGASPRELREAMNRKRPVDKNGKPHDAITSWFVGWRYTTDGSAAGCAVKSFNVLLDITMTLPHWTNEADAAPQLVHRWRSYYAALMTHEEGHKAIASGAEAAIREAGSKLPAQPGCNELAKAIESVTGEILERYRQREQEYDRETDHGRTQGARFP